MRCCANSAPLFRWHAAYMCMHALWIYLFTIYSYACGPHAFTRSLAEPVCHAAGERAAAEWTFTLLLVALTMCGVCTYVA